MVSESPRGAGRGSPAPVDLILHIGSDKTGTTSLQRLLHRNRDLLAEAGVLYPRSPGPTRHTRIGLFIRPDEGLVRTAAWRRESFDSPQQFRRVFRRRLRREMARASLPRMLLSDEALFGASDQGLHNLRRLTDRVARTVQVVVYLRRQDERLASRYQQEVKVGETERLADRVRRDDLPRLYDYAYRLDRWAAIVEPDRMTVRPFEPAHFAGGSLHRDFLDAVGIDLDLDGVQSEPRNASLGVEGVEVLRLVNLLRRDQPDLAPKLPENRILATALGAHDTGPVVDLPADRLDAFMDRWRDGNDRLASRFLDRDRLFTEPRRPARGTTRQVLPPDRLDHYLEVLGVPEDLHDPLRELARAEAQGA